MIATPRWDRLCLITSLLSLAFVGIMIALGSRHVLAVPNVLYVAPDGDCNGASPCFAAPQAAVADAVDGDLIKIAAGEYTGVQNVPSLNARFFTATQIVAITESVTVRGGYSITDWQHPDPVANPTTFDALDLGRVLVMVGDASPTIEGLRLVHGNAKGLGGVWNPWSQGICNVGAGLYVITATATISNLEISENIVYPSPIYGIVNKAGGMYGRGQIKLLNNLIADNSGECTAGVYLENASGARIIGNTFRDNDATGGNCYTGGGLYVDGDDTLVERNVFTGNDAYGGGALGIHGDATVADNLIVDNSAVYGGGVQVTGGEPVLSRNLITGNTASQAGGGVSVFNCWPSCAPVLTNNVLTDNTMEGSSSWFLSGGSAVLAFSGVSIDLVHNTVARNHCPNGDGSAVFVYDHASLALTNSILASEPVGIRVTNESTATINGLLWSSTPVTIVHDFTSTVVVQHQYTGAPAFDSDGYHITPASAAINRGIATKVGDDLDGEARPFGPAPDLGADEWASVESAVEPGAVSTLLAVVDGLTTTIEIPAGAVTESITIRFTAWASTTHGGPTGLSYAQHAFDLDAYRAGVLMPCFAFERPVTATLLYRDRDVAGLDEASLMLAYRSNGVWIDTISLCPPELGYERHLDENKLALPICYLGRFGLFGTKAESRRIYLPLIVRSG